MGCVVACRSEGRSSSCIKGWEGYGVLMILLFLLIASAGAANKSAVHPIAIIHTTAGDLKCDYANDLHFDMTATDARCPYNADAEEHFRCNVIYECDFPLWPQFCLLNRSDSPHGIVRVFQCSPAWIRATRTICPMW